MNPESLSEQTDPDYQIQYIDIGNVSLTDGIQALQTYRFGDAPSRARKIVANGDLLISTVRTYLKAIALVQDADPDWVASTGFAVCKPTSSVDSRYLFRVAQSNPFVDSVVAASTGISYPAINPSTLGTLKIPIPDLATQKAIADFLDRETARIDQLIEKKQRLLALLDLRQQALLESLVRGQATPGLEMRASGIEWIGQVPAHWLVPRVNQVARLESGHTPSRSEERYWIAEECTIPWFTLGDIWQVRQEGRVYVSSTQEKISPIGMANSAARLLPADTVILSRTASVGFPAILSVPMATTQDFVNWISGPQLRPKYLYYVFRAMRREFDRLMIGSTHKTIYMPDVRKFSTPLPPLTEQDDIVRRLDQTLEEHEQLVTKTESTVVILREYRASLITAAVTGQLDIAAWNKRGETERRLEAVEAAV